MQPTPDLANAKRERYKIRTIWLRMVPTKELKT
jgi:hypothetical protein